MKPISTRTRLLGVAGWPVEHSLSPAIQNAAIAAAGLDLVYLAFAIPPERFSEAVRGLAAVGAVGLNCTIPHKKAALEICDEVTDEARLVGAVNTLHFRGQSIRGANTDVEGFVESLRRDGGCEPAGRRAVLLGAGGAARGMALGLAKAGVARLTIVNRSEQKALDLASDLGGRFPRATFAALAANAEENVRSALAEADLVANATSLGLAEGDAMPCDVSQVSNGALVFDAAYTRSGKTAWLRLAEECGLQTLNGLGMLVRQGAASLRIWTGVTPDLDAMFAALREARDGPARPARTGDS